MLGNQVAAATDPASGLVLSGGVTATAQAVRVGDAYPPLPAFNPYERPKTAGKLIRSFATAGRKIVVLSTFLGFHRNDVMWLGKPSGHRLLRIGLDHYLDPLAPLDGSNHRCPRVAGAACPPCNHE